MPFHVRLTPKRDRSHDEVKLDLDKEELERRFLRPYAEGRPIVVGGRTIPADDIGRIRINYTDELAAQLLPMVKAERARSGGIAPISDDWYIAKRGRDVTDEYIEGPPGYAVLDSQSASTAAANGGLTSRDVVGSRVVGAAAC